MNSKVTCIFPTHSVSESTTTEPVNNPATLEPTDTQENDHATGSESDNAPIENEVNRELQVVCMSNRVYLALSRVDNVDFIDDVELIGCSPWFDRAALEQENVVPTYATDGWFPGGVSLEVTTTSCWRNQYACYNGDLII